MTTLKPCPFCGSEDLVSQWNTQSDYEQHYYWEIWCNKCGNGEVLGPSLPRAKSKAVTIDLWNTRPIEDKLQAELEKYKNLPCGICTEDVLINRIHVAKLQAELQQAKAEAHDSRVSSQLLLQDGKRQAEEIARLKEESFIFYAIEQRKWSAEAFGNGMRTGGLIEHIKSELLEIGENPECLEEWVDVIMLAVDGAWRAGYSPQEILFAIKSKLQKNKKRKWNVQSDDNKPNFHLKGETG